MDENGVAAALIPIATAYCRVSVSLFVKQLVSDLIRWFSVL